ncbi:hypothetical protein LLE75_10820, partial [Staphylococcus epidermidis]|nr:hypothetical protein [Staphylococcus epidermidis]
HKVFYIYILNIDKHNRFNNINVINIKIAREVLSIKGAIKLNLKVFINSLPLNTDVIKKNI